MVTSHATRPGEVEHWRAGLRPLMPGIAQELRSGAGHQILRSWKFELPDGRRCEVVVVASTLLRVEPGPIPKRYVVAYGAPHAQVPGRHGDHVIGEYDDYTMAESAAESWIRDKQSGDADNPR